MKKPIFSLKKKIRYRTPGCTLVGMQLEEAFLTWSNVSTMSEGQDVVEEVEDKWLD